MAPTGVLLLQLGTPDSPRVGDVRRFLREFLSDPRVLDMPAAGRALLLYGIILPFRPRRSAHAYRKIWTDRGSPLIIHSEALAEEVQDALGDDYVVALGMRYRRPSVEAAVDQLMDAGCDPLVVVPLFPQYASSSGGSALAQALEMIGRLNNVPQVATVGPFYDDPGFLDAAAAVARPFLDDWAPEHVLFSYHGLPEKHVRKADPTGSWCLADEGCCARIVADNRSCYRAQCFATTRALAFRLALPEGSFTTTFQSRLRGQKWIEPYTDHHVEVLRRQGVSRLAVLTPSFVADCLETLEEIGIRLREQWHGLGGQELLLVPCVNAEPPWVEAVADMVRRARPRPHPPGDQP